MKLIDFLFLVDDSLSVDVYVDKSYLFGGVTSELFRFLNDLALNSEVIAITSFYDDTLSIEINSNFAK